MNQDGTIWAFDLGKASIGEAVRRGTKFLHKASLLIPADFAETKTAASRRRMWRTRQAHKAREQWLNEVMREAGIEVLHGRNYDKAGNWKAGEPADERLEREFAKSGDSTCYTSCLLRIKLLRGEKLEPWQVYKALHSAVQRRGYGKVPWAAREAARHGMTPEEFEKKEKADLEKKDPAYKAAIEAWPKFKQEVSDNRFHYPAYYDAAKIGLWSPVHPDILQERITCQAQSTSRVRFDRDDVEKEIRALVDGAAKHHPKLTGRAKYLLYGPTETAYASFDTKLRKKYHLKEGGANDWQGVLGQKIPRFDNRILNDCVLIPRFHVCKTEIRKGPNGQVFSESLLPAEVTFLMKLKNTLVAGVNGQRKLTVEEIRTIFETVSADVRMVKPDAKEWSKKVTGCFALTKSAWARTKGIKELFLRPLPGHEEIKQPKASGRSGFSRPALRLVKELILSGQSPSTFHSEQLAKLNTNADPMKGLVAQDFKFLRDMGDSWDFIHIPSQKLDILAVRHTEDGHLNIDNAVADLLSSVNDPVVRHRLGVFAERLRFFRDGDAEHKGFGIPDEVVLEFVREDFMGPKRKAELQQFQRDREKSRKEAREKASELGAEEKSAPLKYELFKAQGCVCLYCGQPFLATKLEHYEIDHIVPRSQGGPDAMVNYVLAHRDCNGPDGKGERTPFQWKNGKDGWDAYKQLVERHSVTLRNKKVQLLLREDAPELVSRYTALAETAWITKLAQTIVSICFGWQNGIGADGRKRVTAISGGLTGRIRRKYRLNSILNPCPESEDPFLWEEKCEKNRSDDRHHALDAMVISFIPSWVRDARKEHFFRFPEPIHQNAKGFFDREIAGVIPKNIALEKPSLEETIYGRRVLPEGEFAVGRVELKEFVAKTIKGKRSLKKRADIETHRIIDGRIRSDVEKFLDGTPNFTLADWDSWCAGYSLGTNGPRVRLLTVTKSKANSIEEYKDLSKDGTGQLKRGAKHRGYFVYERPAPTKKEPGRTQIEVQPVYVHESKAAVMPTLSGKIHGYFESGCSVGLKKAWTFQNKEYPADDYICTSIWANRNAKLRHPKFGEIGPVGLRILLDAGLNRID